MGVDRRFPPHRLENLSLTEGVRQVIVAPDRVGDAHVVVVDDDRQHVGRGSVGAQHDQVVHFTVGDRDLALDGILQHRFAVLRRAEANHGIYIRRCVRRIAIAPGAVISHGSFFGLCPFAHFRQFFRRAVAAIGVTPLEQFLDNGDMTVALRKLVDGVLVGAQPQPLQAAENGIDGFRRRSLAVRVLDPQQVFAARVAGIQPVEQRRAGTADMEKARRGRGETCHDAHDVQLLDR